MKTIEEVREYFKKDRYAALTAGILVTMKFSEDKIWIYR